MQKEKKKNKKKKKKKKVERPYQLLFLKKDHWLDKI